MTLRFLGISPLKHLSLAAAILLAATTAQAELITSFENLDFDAGVANSGTFKGFDTPIDIPGWTDVGSLNDAGVEGPSAWWGPYDDYAAFMSSGDSAYTMSTYTIQSGDEFDLSFYAMHWEWTGSGEWTVSLFYDDPANVIGSFVQGDLPNNGTWNAYASDTSIAATPASVGGTLGILVTSTGTGISQIDELTVNLVPEPSTIALLGLCGAAMLVVRRRVA